MGFLDRLLGRDPYPNQSQPPHGYSQPSQANGRPAAAPGRAQHVHAERTPDERAIERYRYLLATAPPEAVEQAHAEAFAQLTPEQRQQVLQQLAEHVPAAERQGDSPAELARMATRAEMRQPGTMERTFGGTAGRQQGAPGFGAMVGGSMLGTIAGVVVGSAIANTLFGPAFGDLSSDTTAAGDGGAEGGDGGADPGGGDADYAAAGGDEYGGGGYEGGGFGGGDFGGGDFGGGDFGGDLSF